MCQKGSAPRHQQTGGDAYLRTLLIHGARAVIRVTQKRIAAGQVDPKDWLVRLLARRNANMAAVALANKNARIAWALLAHPERRYEANYCSRVVKAAA